MRIERGECSNGEKRVHQCTPGDVVRAEFGGPDDEDLRRYVCIVTANRDLVDLETGELFADVKNERVTVINAKLVIFE